MTGRNIWYNTLVICIQSPTLLPTMVIRTLGDLLIRLPLQPSVYISSGRAVLQKFMSTFFLFGFSSSSKPAMVAVRLVGVVVV